MTYSFNSQYLRLVNHQMNTDARVSLAYYNIITPMGLAATWTEEIMQTLIASQHRHGTDLPSLRLMWHNIWLLLQLNENTLTLSEIVNLQYWCSINDRNLLDLLKSDDLKSSIGWDQTVYLWCKSTRLTSDSSPIPLIETHKRIH